MTHADEVVERLLRAKRQRAAMGWIFGACSGIATLTYIYSVGHPSISRYTLRGSAPIDLIKVGWPFLLAGCVAVPQITSRRSDFLKLGTAIVVITFALCAYYMSMASEPFGLSDYWSSSVMSLIAMVSSAHFIVDGIED